MDNPQLYAQNNQFQRTDIQRLLDEYIHLIRWNSHGADSVMDIGCGPGDITTEILLPQLPESLQELVATDVSPKMIQYARRHHQHPRVSYDILDIATKTLPPAYHGRFDHIFSTYCLHWVQDQRQAMYNIYDMLRPGGDILLVYIAQHPVYEVWVQLASKEHWRPYMAEPQKYTAAHQYVTNVEYSLQRLLQEAGYGNITCHCRRRTHVHDNIHAYMVNSSAFNPYLSQLPDHLRERYLREFIDEVKNKMDSDTSTSEDSDKLLIPYSMIIINARKPEQTFESNSCQVYC